MGSEQTADGIVIRGGRAGVPLATRLAAAGKRVLVAERCRHPLIGAGRIVDGEYVHPTFGEGLQSALMTLPRYALRS